MIVCNPFIQYILTYGVQVDFGFHVYLKVLYMNVYTFFSLTEIMLVRFQTVKLFLKK